MSVDFSGRVAPIEETSTTCGSRDPLQERALARELADSSASTFDSSKAAKGVAFLDDWMEEKGYPSGLPSASAIDNSDPLKTAREEVLDSWKRNYGGQPLPPYLSGILRQASK